MCYAPPLVTTSDVGNLASKVVNGVRTLHLIAELVTRTLLDNVNGKTLHVQAWSYNGSTPGPTIVATMGEHIAITVMDHANITPGTFPDNPDSSAFNSETINGRAYPSTSPLLVRLGKWIRIRFLNISQFNHPMHLHGQYFQWVAVDRQNSLQPIMENTVLATSEQTEDIVFISRNPGIWPLHCHLPHHITNNGCSGEGGMFTVIKYINRNCPPSDSSHGRG